MCAGMKTLRLICRFIESLPAQNVRAHYHEDLDAEVDYYDEEASIKDVFSALAANEFFLEEVFGKLTNGDFHWSISGKTLYVRYCSTFTGPAIFKLSNICNGVLDLAYTRGPLGYSVRKYDASTSVIVSPSQLYEFDVDENLSVDDVVQKITKDVPTESTLYWNMVIKRSDKEEPPTLALTFVWDKSLQSNSSKVPAPAQAQAKALATEAASVAVKNLGSGNKRARTAPAPAAPAPAAPAPALVPTNKTQQMSI